MRTKNSVRNIIISCLSYAIFYIGKFVARTVFSKTLGLEVVGIDNTFTQILSALAIVEAGLGVGIVYKLCAPIANEDWEQVSSILCFLRKSYVVISAAVMSLGFIVAYFVVTNVKEDFSKPWLMKIFILYILSVVASYLYSHKRSMFIADQKNYVNNLIHISVQILMFGSQIAVLKIFGSFEAYLICMIVCNLIENIWISYRFDKRYSFIDLKTKSRLPDIEKKDLFRNIRAMLFHKISGYGAGISTLIISYGIGLKMSGVFSNYMVIVTAINTITNEVFNGIIASFGNLLNASESKEKVYDNFNTLYFMNFLIYSFCVSAFVCVITPFMKLWMGIGSEFDMVTVIFIAGYLYIYGIRQSLMMAKVSAGIYDPDKYISLLGSALTLVSAFFLSKFMGVSGVMLGNIIGIVAIPYFIQSYLVYNMVFRKSTMHYHKRFALYTFLTALYTYVSYIICGNIGVINSMKANFGAFLANHLKGFNINSSDQVGFLISQVAINFIICVIVPNCANIVIFSRSKEFKKLVSSAKMVLVRR